MPSNIQNVALKSMIGDGLSSTVYSGEINNQSCAIKVFKKNTTQISRQEEINNMKLLTNPHLLSLLYYDEQPNPVCIITELCDRFDLFCYTSLPNKPFPLPVARYLARELFKAMYFIHNKGFVHRDIKLENILISLKDYQLKLCDLGFAVNTKDKEIEVRCVGTGGYIAPELHNGEKDIETSQLYAADVFSFAAVVFALVNGILPFGYEEPWKNKLLKLFYRKRYEQYWSMAVKQETSESFKELMQGCLGPVSERWTLHQILISRWMNEDVCTQEEYIIEMDSRKFLLLAQQ